MKRFTVRGFRYPEDSPLARLQELENMIEDGDLAEVIPSLDEDLYRRINDLEKALSAERQMAKFYKHKYLEALAVPEKIFGELEASFCILSYPVITATCTRIIKKVEGLHIRTEDYETVKKMYMER